MIRLGLSLYPEKENMADIERYLATGAKYGFDLVFVSLFSVPGTVEEVTRIFHDFGEVAHKHGYKVSGDCNFEFFHRVGATPENLKAFKDMNVDILRMDMPFNDERDATLINNNEGIDIEMGTAMIDCVENAIKNGADPKRILTCHCFYPERYTAPALKEIDRANEYWKSKNIPVTMFVSSQVKGAHGPWPVCNGLPTIEEHRHIPVEAQLKHMIALKNVSEARLANAFASEEEMKAMKEVVDKSYINVGSGAMGDDGTGLMAALANFLPHGEIARIPFKLHTDPGLTDIERKFVFDFPVHNDMGDCLNYMLRSRFTRFVKKDTPVAPRPCDKKVFTRGDVLIVNDNCRHYAAEVQIVLKDMENDGERNYIGRIDESEIMILDHMGARDVFTFIEA